jgi:DNA-binding MarR family transcriptional regulator
MAITTNIIRPQIITSIDDIPKELISFGLYTNLTVRDVSVLRYILSRPENWNFDVKDISKGVTFSESTVRTAIKVLQKEGYASYCRSHDGKTVWTFLIAPEKKGDGNV